MTAYDVWTAVLLYLCMPVGMILLWAHPTWPTRRKVILTGVTLSVIVVPLFIAILFAVTQFQRLQ